MIPPISSLSTGRSRMYKKTCKNNCYDLPPIDADEIPKDLYKLLDEKEAMFLTQFQEYTQDKTEARTKRLEKLLKNVRSFEDVMYTLMEQFPYMYTIQGQKQINQQMSRLITVLNRQPLQNELIVNKIKTKLGKYQKRATKLIHKIERELSVSRRRQEKRPIRQSQRVPQQTSVQRIPREQTVVRGAPLQLNQLRPPPLVRMITTTQW